MARIGVLLEDITTVACDAIVNAANSSLLGGGGVDGAIHRAAGPSLVDQCRDIVARQGSCSPGEAVITGAGNLPALNVVHTVGPVWQDNSSKDLDGILSSCYRRSIDLAIENGCESIAFPSISTGVYRYPLERAANVAIETVRKRIAEPDAAEWLKEVLFVCFDPINADIYDGLLVSQNVDERIDGLRDSRLRQATWASDDNEDLKRLIRLGNDVTATDEDGWTALHHAAVHGYIANARLLLNAGADASARTNHGLTAAELASTNQHAKLAKTLEDAAL